MYQKSKDDMFVPVLTESELKKIREDEKEEEFEERFDKPYRKGKMTII